MRGSLAGSDYSHLIMLPPSVDPDLPPLGRCARPPRPMLFPMATLVLFYTTVPGRRRPLVVRISPDLVHSRYLRSHLICRFQLSSNAVSLVLLRTSLRSPAILFALYQRRSPFLAAGVPL